MINSGYCTDEQLPQTPAKLTRFSSQTDPVPNESREFAPANAGTIASDVKSGDKNVLKRKVGLVSATSLIIGVMIGSGIFVSPGGLLAKTGSVGLCLSVWVACGLISVFGAITYIELGTVVPSSGGEYAYLVAAFGPIPGFLFAWVSTLILKPSSVAIICLSFAQYCIEPFLPLLGLDGLPPDDPHLKWSQRLLCGSAILLITFINATSVSLATKVQNFFTLAKLVAIAIIVGAGIYNVAIGNTELLKTGFAGSKWNYGSLASSFYNGLWAYDGWNNLNYITEEIIDPYRNLPLAILIGLPLVTICYFLVNVAYLTVASMEEIIQQPVAILFGNRMLGVLAFLMPVSVALSTLGAANGTQFTAGRLCYVAGRGGHLVEFLSYIDIRRHTPSVAMVFNATIGIGMTLFLNIEGLIDFFSFTAWIFYGAAVAALIRLRWTMPDAPRPFKVPLIIPIFVVLVAVFLVVAPIVQHPKPEYLYATGFIVLGILVYLPFCHYKYVLPGMGKVTEWMQLLFQVLPPDTDPDAVSMIPPPQNKQIVDRRNRHKDS